MKITSKPKQIEKDEMKKEYSFDYSKAKKNPYAKLLKNDQVFFPLDKEIVEVFKTPAKVNRVLKAIIGAYSR